MCQIVLRLIGGAGVLALAIGGLRGVNSPGLEAGIPQDPPPPKLTVPKGEARPVLPEVEHQAEPKGVTIRGLVVDDETGAPVEFFGLQRGRVDDDDPSKLNWGESVQEVPNSHMRIDGKAIRTPNPQGEFSNYVSPGKDRTVRGVWLRVLADGYEPRPVTDRPFDVSDAGKTIELTVRLRRGEPLVGQVVDHLGRPAAGAKLFLIRPNGGRVQIVDDVVGEGSDTGLLDPTVTRALADGQGRFRITGLGDAIAVGVSAPRLHFWTVPVPEAGEELTIRLPEPATLRIPYAIEGDAVESEFRLGPKTTEELRGRLGVLRNVQVVNGEEAVLRDVTPGEYGLHRSKTLTIGEYRQRVSVDHQTFTVESGRENVVDFVRHRGERISGAVIEDLKGEAGMMFVGIEAVNDPQEPLPLGALRLLDIVACDKNARFRTARIPPGDYVVHVVGYRGRPRYGPFITPLIEAVDFRGSAPVTVPAVGKPPEVCIVLTDGRPPRAAFAPLDEEPSRSD
ncbi:hypothetical protein BH23PLA1_BH23PLA1_05120 [soil metagenome]